MTWTPDRVQRVRDMLDRNEPRAVVCAEMSVTKGMLASVVFRLRHNLPIGGPNKNKTVAAATVAKIRAAAADGLTQAQIAQRLGLTPSSLRTIVSRARARGEWFPQFKRQCPAAPVAVVKPPKPGKAVAPPAPAEPARTIRIRIAQVHHAKQQAGVETVAPAIPRMVAPSRLPPSRPVGRDCQWLEGDRRPWVPCSLPVARGSYCACHAERAFQSRRVAEAVHG